jgi:hypothetical protein
LGPKIASSVSQILVLSFLPNTCIVLFDYTNFDSIWVWSVPESHHEAGNRLDETLGIQGESAGFVGNLLENGPEDNKVS